MEELTIIIPTYNRPETLMKCVDLLFSNLLYDYPSEVIIGDDSSEGNYEANAKWIDTFGWPGIKHFQSPRRGLGANLNFLLRMAETELIMQLDDDHMLVGNMDINEYCEELLSNPAFGWIRLFMGDEYDSGNKQTYYKFVARTYGRYWRLLPKQGELYLPSNRPHLKIKEFHRRYGPYSENVKLGETETEFCHRFADSWPNDGLLDVFIPMYGIQIDDWKHVGESWQKQGL